MNSILVYFAIKYKGYFHDIYKALKNKEYIPFEELEMIQEKISKNEIKAITIIDDDYPEELKLINNPPFVLFYKGNKKLLSDKKIILTGDFKNDSIEKFILNSMDEISKNHSLISNYSKGLDEEIVEYFINNNKKIILISPNGLNEPFFAKAIDESKVENGNILILSESPNGSNINKRRLIQRNRISMGLSQLLIIASSFKESKILSLVSFALEQGKDVFCFPGLQDEEDGNNLLIRDGATMITSIKETIS